MTEPDTVMDPHDTRPGIPDEDLHAWLDGRLPEDQRHAVDDRLAHDPAARDTVAAYRSQREALHGLHRTLLDEPVPPALQAAALRLADSRQRTSQWWRWGGMAAGFVLVFATGWLSHGQWQAVRDGETIVGPLEMAVIEAAINHQKIADAFKAEDDEDILCALAKKSTAAQRTLEAAVRALREARR